MPKSKQPICSSTDPGFTKQGGCQPQVEEWCQPIIFPRKLHENWPHSPWGWRPPSRDANLLFFPENWPEREGASYVPSKFSTEIFSQCYHGCHIWVWLKGFWSRETQLFFYFGERIPDCILSSGKLPPSTIYTYPFSFRFVLLSVDRSSIILSTSPPLPHWSIHSQ